VKPIPFSDIRTFCRVDGWICGLGTEGRKTRKHEVWTKSLPDGTTLRVVISKGRGDYSPQMAAYILKQGLRVTENEFWLALRTRQAPQRPEDRAWPEGELLPLSLVRALLAAGCTQADLAGLTRAQAEELLKRGK
jgi:hypothetical protein